MLDVCLDSLSCSYYVVIFIDLLTVQYQQDWPQTACYIWGPQQLANGPTFATLLNFTNKNDSL